MPGLRKAEELTNAIIDKIPKPAKGTRPVYWDALVPGLGLRVSDTGAKTWIVTYRVRGGSRTMKRMTIGPYGKLRGQVPLTMARDRAREIVARAAAGEDPQAEKQAAKESPTVAELAKDYLEKYAVPRKRSARLDTQILNTDVVPAWGLRKAADIKRRDVAELLEGIVERGAPVQANRVLGIVRRMYNWAIERDLVEMNPCLQVKAPTPETPRDRVLTDGELRAIWRACEDEAPVMAALFRLHMLTAQRGGEVKLMRWADLDLQAGWWTIPAAHAKNKLAHRVPLSLPAVQILKDLPQTCEWVFPSPKRPEPGQPWPPIANAAKAHGRIRERSGVDFVPHDFRRTAASMMASIGVPRLVVGKVLNHVDQDVTGRHYERYSYDREKREALDMWAQRLMVVVG